MTNETGEQLAAFLDGAMSTAESAQFAARLSLDRDLAAMAQRWLANDRLIAAAFAPIALAPIPPAMLRSMGFGETSPAIVVPGAANDNAPWWWWRTLPLGGAVAASLAAVLLLTSTNSDLRQRDLSFALETGRSLNPVRLSDGSFVTPTLTVKSADGRWCREFRQASTIGLACRDAGHWTIEVQGDGRGPTNGSGIAVASGDDGSVLDSNFARLRTSDPIDGNIEAELIAKGWPAR